MQFKYQSNIDVIPNCPAAEFTQRAGTAYRYVFQEDVPGSFRPALAINPSRAIKWDDVQRCSGWTLSFFTSIATARAKFAALQRVNPKIHKALGNAVAEGTIQHADGVRSAPDVEGHFELHESNSAQLEAQFALVEALM